MHATVVAAMDGKFQCVRICVHNAVSHFSCMHTHTQDYRSSVQLLDGTAAMVRCMRKGNGALECPVCLQLFNAPVVPVDSDCR